RGPEPAPLRLLPTLWFRNTWSWESGGERSQIESVTPDTGQSSGVSARALRALHPGLGEFWLACEGAPQLLFTENETNARRLSGIANPSRLVKDGLNDAIVNGDPTAVDTNGPGTKVAAHYPLRIAPSATETVHLRLSAQRKADPFAGVDACFAQRAAEADR